MGHRSGLFIIVVFCFAIFLSISYTTASVIDGRSVVVGRAFLEPINERPDEKPPPKVYKGPEPQVVDPASQQKPGSAGTRDSIKALLKTKLIYPVYRGLKINARPVRGTSGIAVNKGTGKMELVIGYNDMRGAWEAGRGVQPDLTKDIIADFPVTEDPSRDASRQENLEILIRNEKEPWKSDSPVGHTVVRAGAKDGIKYTRHLQQAREQAFQAGREMSIVRPGMTRKEASKYRSDTMPLLNAPTWARPPPAAVIRPGDPGWKRRMYGWSAVGEGLYLEKMRGATPYDDPYILMAFPEVDFNPPPRPADYHPDPLAPDELPPSRNKRGVNLDNLYGQSSDSTSDPGNDLTNEAAQFELFYEAFQTVQTNISTLIFPILQTMVNNSNASTIYHAAWSIWAELTMADDIVDGPFSSGFNRLAAIEDDYARANNMSMTSDAYKTMLAVNGVLINKYETAWNQSLKAVNASGLLDLRDTLADNLQLANGTGIESPDFTTLNTEVQGIQWFVQYDVPVNGSSNSTSAR